MHHLKKRETRYKLCSHRLPVPRVTHVYTESCLLLYCIMRPYTDGPIGPLSYRHSRELSEIRTQPWLSEGSLTCDPYHHRGPIF